MPDKKIKRSKPQGKINPRIVAQGLAEGKKKIDIAVEAGSNANSDSAKATSVTRVLNSDKYKEEALPFVEKLIKERDRALKALEVKDLSEVEYEKVSNAIDKFTKNIQLLSGKPTGITEVNLEKADEIKKALEDV